MIFLKLGGSLITAKDQPDTPRLSMIQRLAGEIAEFRAQDPEEPLLLGHGSGSFGHVAAAQHEIHKGITGREDWRGFAEVWAAARQLHNLVLDALLTVDLSVVSFPPSASGVCEDGELVDLAVSPLRRVMEAGLLPVVYGDVAVDRIRGAAVLSTEAVFSYLAREMRPDRFLLAGTEPGVYADYPAREELIPIIKVNEMDDLHLAEAENTDVTGGMKDKVARTADLVAQLPDLEAWIFSGEEPDSVRSALSGQPEGTLIAA